MAKRVSSTPPSVKRYAVFLIIVFVTAVVSLTLYISLDKKSQLEKNDRWNFFQGKLSKNSVLIQKIKEAAIKTDKNNFAGPFLLNNIRNYVNKDTKNNTTNPDLHSSVKKTKMDQEISDKKSSNVSVVNYNVHIFYYPWYGNPSNDGKYLHWNHQYIPHWRKEEAHKWPKGIHIPPNDIGANFYPALGPYSSADSVVVNMHMKQIQSSGAGVIVVSWYPPGQADENGQPFDKLIPLLLDSAHKHGLKVAIHIEPYKDRSGETLNHHIKYIINSYGHHPGFYRREVHGKQLPVYYVYDSYQIDSVLWAQALKPDGRYSVRGTKYDGIFLGLYVGPENERTLLDSGFDGFYTYFAASGFTKGSTLTNWKAIARFANRHNLLFVPSVGPGYLDTRVRPWNGENTRHRLHGQYFRQSFQSALDAKVKVISVTSFNEWHEGTQVEPAVPKVIDGFKYEDYSPETPDFYLKLLKEYVDKFSQE